MRTVIHVGIYPGSQVILVEQNAINKKIISFCSGIPLISVENVIESIMQ